MSEKHKNVPQWMVDSKTDITEQNDEVGLVVAGYIGEFRKRGFSQKQIGIMLSKAFLLPLDEVIKRVDAVLSCKADDEDSVRNLCAFVVEKGGLFSTEDTDPVEVIALLNNKYGKTATFEILLTFPNILSAWKKEAVRDLPENQKAKIECEKILYECSSVFPEK